MFGRLVSFLPASFRSLAERFVRGPIDSVEGLTGFVQTRAAYVAQTSLYGYLKTRMGTKFRVYFEDEAFSQTIRVAAVKVFASCLADLTVFAAAVAAGDRLGAKETAELAQHCFREALNRAITERDAAHLPEGTFAAFEQRLRQVSWPDAAKGERAFAASGPDLVRHAPVIEEFKDLDREIVQNSIRFRWRDVREQLRRRIDGDAIRHDWQSRSVAEAVIRQ